MKRLAGELTERQREVLALIIQNFILTANPVGSRFLAKHSDLGLSDATIRNVMADLEEMGYVTHPHTSAGRLPTDKGYRFYVDSIMKISMLSAPERLKIDHRINQVVDGNAESNEILRESSRILGSISKQLGVVLSPKYSTGVFEKLEIVSISSNKILVIVSVLSGFVKTIMLEVRTEVKRNKIEPLVALLNERLSGLTLEEIRQTFSERLSGVDDSTGLLRLFVDSADRVFDDPPINDRIHISGADNIIFQPEFEKPERIRGIVEMVENENVIVHLVEDSSNMDTHLEGREDIKIIIGKENRDSKIKDCSIVTAEYEVGDVMGVIGVIGPTRMNYAKVVRILDYMAKRISDKLISIR